MRNDLMDDPSDLTVDAQTKVVPSSVELRWRPVDHQAALTSAVCVVGPTFRAVSVASAAAGPCRWRCRALGAWRAPQRTCARPEQFADSGTDHGSDRDRHDGPEHGDHYGDGTRLTAGDLDEPAKTERAGD